MLETIIQYKAEIFWSSFFFVAIIYIHFKLKDGPRDIEEIVAEYEAEKRRKQAQQI